MLKRAGTDVDNAATDFLPPHSPFYTLHGDSSSPVFARDDLGGVNPGKMDELGELSDVAKKVGDPPRQPKSRKYLTSKTCFTTWG